MFKCKFVPSKIGTHKNGDHAPQSCCFSNRSKRTLLLVMIVAIASVTVSTTVAVLLSNRDNLTVPSFGTIKTIGVETYWDPNRENKAELINWDEMLVGTSKDITVYIRSVSDQKVTLDLEATDWNPTKLADYTALSWDYNGASLDPRRNYPSDPDFHFLPQDLFPDIS